MEGRLGKFRSTALATVLLLAEGGCSPIAHQTAKPIPGPELPNPITNPSPNQETPINVGSDSKEFTLVDCQANPLDKSKDLNKYYLNPGGSVNLIAITKSGEKDSITFSSAAPGVMRYGEEINKFHASLLTNSEAILKDENVLFIVVWDKVQETENQTILGATATCADAVEK